MGKITETVKILLIINVIFYLGSTFVIDSNQAMEWFALWYFEHPGFQFWQPLTHMFMHDLSSPFHLIFNMYALWMFGSSIEQVLGQKRFVFFYFSAGLGAALIHSLVNYYNFTVDMQSLMDLGFTSGEIQGWLKDAVFPGSYINGQGIPVALSQDFFNSYNIPAVGASGAIYGVLVAFGMLFPNASLGLIFVPIPIKAKYFIPGLLLIDLFSGVTGFSIFGANIANWAHLGGALFGFIVMWYWKKKGMNTYN
jgi:membrane associated rhomboid family serine protease